MSIFNRRDPEPAKEPMPAPVPRSQPRSQPVVAEGHERTHIAVGSKVVGEISGKAELIIDGRVEGKIDLASKLIIGPKGQVEGEVKARSVQIGGRVLGNVHGLERVEVLKSGRLEGDMVAPQNGVHIAEGAFFTGKIDMSGGSTGRGDAKGRGGSKGKEPKGNSHKGKMPADVASARTEAHQAGAGGGQQHQRSKSRP